MGSESESFHDSYNIRRRFRAPTETVVTVSALSCTRPQAAPGPSHDGDEGARPSSLVVEVVKPSQQKIINVPCALRLGVVEACVVSSRTSMTHVQQQQCAVYCGWTRTVLL